MLKLDPAHQPQECWEVDTSQPTQGARRVQATFHQRKDDPEWRAMLEEDGETWYAYQWETDYHACVYDALEDGSFVTDRDGSIRIFATKQEAMRCRLELLQARIAQDQEAVAKLEERLLLQPSA